MSSYVFIPIRSRSDSRASARSRYGVMLRRASGQSSVFSGIGKSPVIMDTASPFDCSHRPFSRTSSSGVWIPSCDALMQRAR